MPATTAPEVELYVRSLTSRTGYQERVIRQLQRLDADGHLSSVTVHIWGEEVELSTTAVQTQSRQSVLDTVAEFRSWADHNDVSLAQFYENKTGVSRLTGEEFNTLRLPMIAMAEYVDGELVSVTPHERENGVRTVEDRLEMLTTTTGEPPRPELVEP